MSPTPEVEAATGEFAPLYERFWLCDRCCRQMTLVWGGTEAKLIPLPKERTASPSTATEKEVENPKAKRRRARAGLHRR